jgi:putative hemolysin
VNYLFSLYSEVNSFKIDFIETKKEKKKWNKFTFILKNIYLLKVSNSLLQTILSLFVSEYSKDFFKNYKESWILIIQSFIILLITEIFAEYLSSNEIRKEIFLNPIILNSAFYLIKSFSWLRIIIKPKKSLFVNSESELALFAKNLTTDGFLEDKEAKLVEAALNFDERMVENVLVKGRKVVYLRKEMTYQEVQEIYLKYFFSNYPVLDESEKVIGVFNYILFNWVKMKNKDFEWQDHLMKELVLPSSTKLNEAFEKLQKFNSQIAIIEDKEKIVGVITVKEILGTLVGNISDERSSLLLDSYNL